jgi:hypothetical protein
MYRLVCFGITGAKCITPTDTMEALTCLPPLDLVVQGKARSAVHQLWSLGFWSYLQPYQGHRSILMRLQKTDPVFKTGRCYEAST